MSGSYCQTRLNRKLPPWLTIFSQLLACSQVIEGKELLSPRTENEREKLKKVCKLSIAVMLSGIELSFCLNIYEIAAHECLRCMQMGVIVIGMMLKKSLTSMPMCSLQKPKNWRLACQTTVGNPDSRGLVCEISWQSS